MDEEFRYDHHARRLLKLPLLLLQPLLLTIWPLSLLSNPLIANPYQLRYLGIMALLVSVSALLAASILFGLARSAGMMILAFTINVWSIAFAFRIQIDDSGPLGLYWNLPVALLITLSTCGLIFRMSGYLLIIAGSWFILFIGEDRLAPETMPWQLVWILIGAALAIGIAYNAVNSHWMRRTFLLKERYRLLSETDELTGIANRRKLLQAVEAALGTSHQSAGHFIMLDIDNFKSINDQHGHHTGDEVLRLVARTMSTLDSALTSGRLGGEEFGLLAQGLSDQRVTELLGELRTRLRRMEQPQITFSAGVVRLHPQTPLAELLKHADEGLYLAKHQGKDQAIWSA